MKNSPIVSICIITYNQEKYIRQCLEAAIHQSIDSKEIIIADDCSTDNTSKICNEYQSKYPNIVKYNRRPHNLGVVGNWIATLKEAKGEFIAFCEGDDYWTDPDKIQKQVNFLVKHKDYILTYHDFVNVRSSSIITEEDIQKAGKISNPMTLTLLFRNKPELYMDVLKCNIATADTPIRYALKGHGKFKHLEDIGPSIRRIHGENVMGAMNRFEQLPMRIQNQEAMLAFYKHTDRRSEIESKLAEMYALEGAWKVRQSKGISRISLCVKEAVIHLKKGVFKYYLNSLFVKY